MKHALAWLRMVLAFPFSITALFCLLIVFALADVPPGMRFGDWLSDEINNPKRI
jgi:hypothetical protein